MMAARTYNPKCGGAACLKQKWVVPGTIWVDRCWKHATKATRDAVRALAEAK